MRSNGWSCCFLMTARCAGREGPLLKNRLTEPLPPHIHTSKHMHTLMSHKKETTVFILGKVPLDNLPWIISNITRENSVANQRNSSSTGTVIIHRCYQSNYLRCYGSKSGHRAYLVAFSNPKPCFQKASAWHQPTIVPPPQGLMCQAPDELAAQCHQVFHSTYEAHSHG